MKLGPVVPTVLYQAGDHQVGSSEFIWGRGQGWSLPLVFFLASKAPPWTRRRLRLGLKTFKLFLDEIPIVFFGTPIKKN